jgi:hypothetical protein
MCVRSQLDLSAIPVSISAVSNKLTNLAKWIQSKDIRKKKHLAASVADPGCLSRIPDPDFYPSRIPDPKTGRKGRGEKKNFVKHFFVATNFTKCKII